MADEDDREGAARVTPTEVKPNGNVADGARTTKAGGGADATQDGETPAGAEAHGDATEEPDAGAGATAPSETSDAAGNAATDDGADANAATEGATPRATDGKRGDGVPGDGSQQGTTDATAEGDTDSVTGPETQAGDVESTLVSPMAMDATGAPADGDAKDGTSGGKGGHRHGKRRPIIIACGIASIAIVAGCLYVGNETASALSVVDEDARAASLVDSNASGLLDRTTDLTDLTDDDIMPDDGGDDGILVTLSSARDAASAAIAEAAPSSDGIAWYAMDEARALRDDAESVVSDKTSAYDSLHSAVSAVTVSKYEREKSDARDALQSSSDDAQSVLDSTEDKVHDNSIRETLASAIDAGNALLADETLHSASIYESAQSRIDEASKAVSDDNAQWQKEKDEEEARAKAAAAKRYSSKSQATAAASASGGSAVQASDGTWYVSYRGNDCEGTANSDMSVSEYRSGYYIAHRSGANGQMIASKPSHVVVDGKSYHYVSSIVVSEDSSLDSALSYARQNGGIGFQTCTRPLGGDIIVHYEPD